MKNILYVEIGVLVVQNWQKKLFISVDLDFLTSPSRELDLISCIKVWIDIDIILVVYSKE